jgi:hypothetical protein
MVTEVALAHFNNSESKYFSKSTAPWCLLSFDHFFFVGSLDITQASLIPVIPNSIIIYSFNITVPTDDNYGRNNPR